MQQTILQVLTPIYEEQFSENHDFFKPSRCYERAVIKALECFNDGNDWIVDIDLQSFFNEVNKEKPIGIHYKKNLTKWSNGKYNCIIYD